MNTVDFISTMLKIGFGVRRSQIEYEDRVSLRAKEKYQHERQERRRLQIYISQLKYDGLIKENSSKKLILSKKGRRKLRSMRRSKIVDEKYYKKESGDKVIIVSYDIPVSFNRERDILRRLLNALGLSKVHQSVWVGKVKVPKEFLVALNFLGILKFVEILEVTKNGTLKEY